MLSKKKKCFTQLQVLRVLRASSKPYKVVDNQITLKTRPSIVGLWFGSDGYVKIWKPNYHHFKIEVPANSAVKLFNKLLQKGAISFAYYKSLKLV